MENLLTLNIPWIESPIFPSLLQENDLIQQTKDLVRQFAADGYVVIDCPSEHMTAIAATIRESLFQTGPVFHRRIQDVWKTCPAVREIATNSGILDILRFLYRREPIPFQTLNFSLGTEQATHSDTIHFHCVPHRFMCGVWVALEDIDEDNGPLHVYPGSHKLPIWDMHDLGLPSGRESYEDYEQAIRTFVKQMRLSKKKVCMKKGQMIIWAANLLHGGEPIRDLKRTRLSQVTHYFFENCLYYTPMDSDPYLGKVKLREIINIVDGNIIPNIYNRHVVPRVQSRWPRFSWRRVLFQ